MDNFSLLIKPASFDCNLRCEYCFYLRKEELYGTGAHRMDDDVLEAMIKSYFKLKLPQYIFAWQGGEPTLMGLDFYRKAVSLMIKYGQGKSVANGFQTNAVLIDDEWARFFREYNFLLGVSVDGPARLHDRYRRDCAGAGSHAKVMKGIDALRRNNVEFNTLTLVSKSNQDEPLTVYRYLRDELHSNYHQYIECVETMPDGRTLTPFALDPHKYGEFLCAIFDEWYKYDKDSVSVRLFDAVMLKLLNNSIATCNFGRDCRHYMAIEHDGGVFPCDFFVEEKLNLGNVQHHSFESMMRSPKYASFGKRKMAVPISCKSCIYYSLCAGCCVKNRPSRGEHKEASFLCPTWKIFYSHTLDRFKLLVDEIRQRTLDNLKQ